MTHALPAQPAALANLLADLSRQFLESVKSYSVDQATTEPPVGSQAELLGQLCKAHEQQERSVHTAAEGPDRRAVKGSVTQRQQILDHLLSDLERCASNLADSVDRNTPAEVPEYCRQPPSQEGITRTLALAHRLSYTSFAPPGYEPGVTQLGNFRPPAPQEWQMRASQLHQFAEERRLADLKQQHAPAPAAPHLVSSAISSMPQMPPGWQKGDPLPAVGEPMEVDEAAKPDTPLPAPGAAAAAPAPARPLVDASEYLLDFEDEEAVSEEAYSDDSDDSD